MVHNYKLEMHTKFVFLRKVKINSVLPVQPLFFIGPPLLGSCDESLSGFVMMMLTDSLDDVTGGRH